MIIGTAEQTAIWAHMRTGSQHAIVEAVAGSGKTTTLIEGCIQLSQVRRDINIALLAFNKPIADELTARMKAAGVRGTASTFNSYGYRQCILNLRGRVSVAPYKTYDILEDILGGKHAGTGFREVAAIIVKLASLCKSLLLLPTPDVIEELVDHYDIALNFTGVDAAKYERVCELLPMVLERSQDIAASAGVVDFDDQIWLPVVNDWKVQQFDLLLVDESQDLSPVQQKLAFRACRNGRIIVVGDSHQAIYAFRGADSSSMQTMRDKLTETPRGVKTFTLSYTRRCPKSHVMLAQALVPQIKALDDAAEGEVGCVTPEQARALMSPGDMVLCRTNKPLVTTAYGLLQTGVKAVVRGADIGANILTLLTKGGQGRRRLPLHNSDQLAGVLADVDSYVVQESAKLYRLGLKGEERLKALADKYGCLKALSDNCNTVGELKRRVENIFADFTDAGKPNDAVVLGTVHKCKGLEAGTVFILEPEKMPHPNAKTAEAVKQEMNLIYVAVTRAKYTAASDNGKPGQLYFVGPIPAPIRVALPEVIKGVAGSKEALERWEKAERERAALRRKSNGNERAKGVMEMLRLEEYGLNEVMLAGAAEAITPEKEEVEEEMEEEA